MAHSDHGEYREEFHAVHAHEYDHHEPKYGIVWAILAVTVVFLILSGIAVQAYVEGLWTRQTYEKVLSQDSVQLGDLRQKEEQELKNYCVADPKTGAMRMPVDQAMKAVIAESATPKYPTAPYAVKTDAELASGSPGVSQPGAAAAVGAENQGVATHPAVQAPPQRQK